MPISKGVLSASSVLDEDISGWKWPRGRFYVTHRKSGGDIVRHFYRGVFFDKAEILDLVERSRLAQRATGKGGRPIEAERWHEFWLSMVLAARSERLDKFEVGNAKAFQKNAVAFYEASNPQTLMSYDTLTKPLRMLRTALVEANPTDNSD